MKKPQVYLELYHGRQDPKEDLDDWGSEGPILGPLNSVCTTYLQTIRLLRFTDENGERLSGDDIVECFMAVYDDMLYYDGVFYGDWAVFSELERANKDVGPILPVEEKCVLPEEYRKLANKSSELLLYQFLFSFEKTWSIQHREQAEDLWKELEARGVSRDCVRETLKQRGMLNAETKD